MPQEELNLEEPRVIPVYLGTPVTYTIPELETKALNFLKENKRKMYSAMSRKERKSLVNLKARAAMRQAENLMATGMDSKDAWNRAIRLEILESNSE